MIRLAIIEDNALYRTALQTYINSIGGIQVVYLESSVNGLLSNLTLNPDVVIMDIDLGKESGIDGVQKIKQVLPAAGILMLTVFEDDEKIFAAICAGASGYILKKTTPAKLIDALFEVYGGGAPMSPGVANRVLRLFQKFAPAPAIQTEDESSLLSKREKEILLLMMDGDNYHDIAKKCFISYDTVRTHVRSIYKKLHVASVNQAIVKAFKSRLF